MYEEDFYKSGAHKASQSGTISKQACYHLMGKVCDLVYASEEPAIAHSQFFKKHTREIARKCNKHHEQNG
ncbi:MAG: hypothetical protein C5B45_05220 [Chlamydiae bacterium]|nr:MAG: hypothetical protein C5B45_05220 [Chlamydiota bacterium]